MSERREYTVRLTPEADPLQAVFLHNPMGPLLTLAEAVALRNVDPYSRRIHWHQPKEKNHAD